MKRIYIKPEIKTFAPAFKEQVLAHSNEWGDSNDFSLEMEEEDEEEGVYFKNPDVWE